MKILIIGFQRSGTTLSRRILNCHPQVKALFHERFLLKRYKTKKALFSALNNIDPNNDNWGEKCPYYPSIRKIPVMDYINTWNEYFGNESRILHIIRHPIDVSLSAWRKRKRGTFNGPLNKYAQIMPKYIPEIDSVDNVMTFKYENLLINPDDVIPQIFEFCGLKSNVNFRKLMKKHSNPKYQSLDASRAFAYKRNAVKVKVNLTKAIKAANKIEGPKYDPHS